MFYHKLIPAVLLRRIQSRVRLPVHRIQRTVIRNRAAADAARHRGFCFYRPHKMRKHAGKRRLRVILPDQDCKFAAAHSAGKTQRTELLLQAFCERAQRRVPMRMPERIIDLFEPVHIQYQEIAGIRLFFFFKIHAALFQETAPV